MDKLKAMPADQRNMIVRKESQAYAEKSQKLQRGQMERFLTLADYEHPYLTMQPEFEGATLEVLAALVEKGLVYRALKPVHWSIANETALAEAELEYMDREDPSVYVDFEAVDAGAVYDAFGLKEAAEDAEVEAALEHEVPTHMEGEEPPSEPPAAAGGPTPRPGVRPRQTPTFMIWTTTPWTLPANLAIAVNPKFEYALVWVDGNISVIAEALVEKVTKLAKSEQVVILAKTTGDKLVGLRYRHPFVDPARGEGPTGERAAKLYSLLPADYVTLEDGTGLVHTAPGHGAEDFDTGKREGLPIYCPVRSDGTYDKTVPAWLQAEGLDVWKANQLVVTHLRESGHMFHDLRFTHSYPHDWRSKTPTIFRCTEQWFVSVEVPFLPKAENAPAGNGMSLRNAALLATSENASSAERFDLRHTEDVFKPALQEWIEKLAAAKVRFVPEWGRNRMRGHARIASRLVHLASALLGPAHPGVLLPR